MIRRRTGSSKSVLFLSITTTFKRCLECQYGLLDHLLQNGCLTAEEIRNLREGYKTEIKRNNELVDLINPSNIDLFEQGLEASNQSHLVNFIRNNGIRETPDDSDWPLDSFDILPIKNSYADLVANIFSNNLIDQLFAGKCLSTEQKTSILSKGTPQEKNRELLDILMRRSVRQLDIFYQCLQNDHPELCSQLLLSKESKTDMTKAEIPDHGPTVKISLAVKSAPNDLNSLDPVKEITILILGETGVGKSTLINSIVNYLNFETLQEVRDAEGIPILIPTTFSILDENYVSRKISIQCKNEKVLPDMEVLSDSGQSTTQGPWEYRFTSRDVTVRLIDTPGIGDVRGPDQDEANFDKILRFLSLITELHGICILLKPNEPRISCITELLKHFHRTAAANIIFCFTHTRGTFYTPGDSLVPLRALLESIKNTGNQGVDIKTKYETMYCLDNEAFRFLCASRQGIHFSQDVFNTISTSWTKSRNETIRLFDYILQLKPHSLMATLSLNEARNIVLASATLVAEISRNILIDITAVERKKKEMKNLDLRDKDLRKAPYSSRIFFRKKAIDHPRTVCTAAKCTITSDVKGTLLTYYKTVCHCPCSCLSQSVNPEVIAHPQLRQCGAMRNGICIVCGCTWDVHLHQKYELELVTENVFDTHTQDSIKEIAYHKDGIRSLVRVTEDRILEQEKRKKQFQQITAKCGSFLKSNAIETYNDLYEAYLQFKIREEKVDVSVSKSDVTLKSLEIDLAMYKEQVEILNQQMDDNFSCKLSPEDIMKLREEFIFLRECSS